jgi:hypothetical protein
MQYRCIFQFRYIQTFDFFNKTVRFSAKIAIFASINNINKYEHTYFI